MHACTFVACLAVAQSSVVVLADLCEAEFDKLSEEEKRFFRAILWPTEHGSGSDDDDEDDGARELP